MSRYTHIEIKDNVKYKVSHGFDGPMEEYFIQVKSEKDHEDDLFLWEGNRTSGASNGEMMQFFEDWGVRKNYPNHYVQLTLDLPF